MTNEEIKSALSRRAERKAKRDERVIQNAALAGESKIQKRQPIRKLIKRGPLKKAIVRLLGLLDAKKNGPLCRLGELCPQFPKIGYHKGDTSYHVVPAQRGDSVRFVPENVVWTCASANYGEVMNRSLYRDKHRFVFGPAFVDNLEALARETKKYTTAELLDLRAEIKAELEKP